MRKIVICVAKMLKFGRAAPSTKLFAKLLHKLVKFHLFNVIDC